MEPTLQQFLNEDFPEIAEELCSCDKK